MPVAVHKTLAKAGLKIDDIDLFEIQEAFAVQALADAKLMGIREEDIDKKVNVNGSGISLELPIGCSGARILVTLINEREGKDAHRGLATLCIGGGQGMAMVLER